MSKRIAASCHLSLLALTSGCSTIDHHPVRIAVDRTQYVEPSSTALEVTEPDLYSEDAVLTATIADRCREVTTIEEGTKATVSRSWGDFVVGGALAATSVFFLAQGLKCHNDPHSCPEEEIEGRSTYNGGQAEGNIAIGFGAASGVFFGHAIYKYAMATDQLSRSTVESDSRTCNRRMLSPSQIVLRLSSDKSIAGRPARSGATAFPGARDWVLDHPESLNRPARIEIDGSVHHVQWSSMLDVDNLRAELEERSEAKRMALAEQAREEQRKRDEARKRALEAMWSRIDKKNPVELQEFINECTVDAPSCDEAKRLIRPYKLLGAVARCGMEHLGEDECNRRVKVMLGPAAASIGCSVLVQKVSKGRVDGLEVAMATLENLAAESDDEFVSTVAKIWKAAKFISCVEEARR